MTSDICWCLLYAADVFWCEEMNGSKMNLNDPALFDHTNLGVKLLLLSHKRILLPLSFCLSFLGLCSWKTPSLLLVLSRGQTDLDRKMALLYHNANPVAVCLTQYLGTVYLVA